MFACVHVSPTPDGEKRGRGLSFLPDLIVIDRHTTLLVYQAKGKKKAVTTVLHLSNGYSCRTRSLLGVGAQIRSELRVKPEREWKARTDPIRNTHDPTCIQGCSNAGPRALAHTRDLTDSRRSTCELCFSASFKKEFSSFKIKGWIAHTICGICVASTNPSVHNMHIKGLTGSKQKNINTSIMLKHRLQSIDRCVISV